MLYLFRTLFTICSLLLSCAYFLWVYQNAGFEFTVRCLFIWGFCSLAWSIIILLILALFDDIL